jgi:uncharacterized protein (TIGR03382 family)
MSPHPLAIALAVLVAPATFAAEIRILDTNDPGTGFNDPTAAIPVGLNFGTTVGQQRLIAFQYAATIWSATLRSDVPILIDSAFLTVQDDSRLSCSTSSGIIGFARLASYSTDQAYPVPGAAYPAALANALVGKDLTSGDPHIVARFNSSLGTPGCLDNQRWYYGLDDRDAPNQDDLVSVALHEFGHGLGFISFVDASTGSFGDDPPSIFDFHARDVARGTGWQGETDAQRKALAVSIDGLSLAGPAITQDVPRFLNLIPTLTVDVPGLPDPVPFAPADFSAPLTGGGTVVATLPVDGCADYTNAGGVAGKVALIQRSVPDGGVVCRFWDKAKRAEDAGATGVILYNYQPGAPLVAPTGSPTLSIPVGFVSLETGLGIANRAAVAPVTATFGNTGQRGGMDAVGTGVLLYTPSTVVDASSVSHFDTTAVPALLMEPRILRAFTHNLDLTPAVMADLGWSVVQGLSVAVAKALEQHVTAGQDANYLVTVLNRRPTEAGDVRLDLALPAGTTVVSTAGACTTGVLPCDLGTLAAGQVLLTVVTVHVAGPVSYPFAVTARVTTSSPGADDVLQATSSLAPASGGCSSSDGGPAAAGLAVLLALWLVRRRARPVSSPG